MCDARRRAGSHLGLHFQNSEQESVEGVRNGTRAQLGFINAEHLDVRMKPFKTQILQVESNRVTASPNI